MLDARCSILVNASAKQRRRVNESTPAAPALASQEAAGAEAGGGGSLYQFGDLCEMGVVGGPEQFK
jgi:hypothetical protein